MEKKNSSVFECITNTRFQCKIRIYIHIYYLLFLLRNTICVYRHRVNKRHDGKKKPNIILNCEKAVNSMFKKEKKKKTKKLIMYLKLLTVFTIQIIVV